MKNTIVEKYQVVEAILYRLKTGCQWRQLPMNQFFRIKYQYQSVCHHHQKWCKDGSWKRVWQYLLNKYKHFMDMSCIQLDGTHTPVKRGGQAVAYQGRKKSKASNMLILTDSRGTPLACIDPVEGNHNDAFNLVPTVKKMIGSIQSSGIATHGLFLNADAGFDEKDFRVYCYQQEIVNKLTRIEETEK